MASASDGAEAGDCIGDGKGHFRSPYLEVTLKTLALDNLKHRHLSLGDDLISALTNDPSMANVNYNAKGLANVEINATRIETLIIVAAPLLKPLFGCATSPAH
jgi:hypothetical protein